MAEQHGLRIIVCPLNWGLGHATRCAPIIDILLQHEYEVHLASSGIAGEWLQARFPELPFHALPDYNISYQHRGSFIAKMALQMPRVLRTIRQEQKELARLHRQFQFSGVISDNRFGCRLSSVPSVFITHQIRVKTPIAQKLVRRVNYAFIRRFDCVWIPDVENKNLAGKLSVPKSGLPPVVHIGLLSGFDPAAKPTSSPVYKYLALISGPEPQRTAFEREIVSQFSKCKHPCAVIRGTNTPVEYSETGNIKFWNRLNSDEVQAIVNDSATVIFRAGYSSIMDLAIHGKKVICVPTPGQTEQEYLAKRLEKSGFGPSVKQGEINLAELEERGVLFTGIPALGLEKGNWDEWLALFQRK